jgi:hypothetical protein
VANIASAAAATTAGHVVDIDASQHRWFCDERWYDLLVIMDDATREIYYAQLEAEESTRTVTTALREVIEQKDLFCALYSDRASHFFLTPKTGEPVDPPFDAGGTSAARVRHSTHSGLFTAGAWSS